MILIIIIKSIIILGQYIKQWILIRDQQLF